MERVVERYEAALRQWRDLTSQASKRLPSLLDPVAADHGAAKTLGWAEQRTARARDIESTIRKILDPGADEGAVGTDGGAKCRPWSLADFVQRVETFRASQWFGKPLQLSPLQCARFGWTNSGKDTLSCACCGEVLVVSGSPSDCSRVLPQLESAHSADCPWRHLATPAEYTILSLVPSGALLARLAARVHRCAPVPVEDARVSDSAVRTALQGVAELVKAEGVPLSLLRLLEAVLSGEPGSGGAFLEGVASGALKHSESETHSSAALVVMCGWDASADGSSLQCAMCRARWACPRGGKRPRQGGDPVAKRGVGSSLSEGETELDCLKRHRWFCPWVQPLCPLQRRAPAAAAEDPVAGPGFSGHYLAPVAVRHMRLTERSLGLLEGLTMPSARPGESVMVPGWVAHVVCVIQSLT
jgi:hypothetical protein